MSELSKEQNNIGENENNDKAMTKPEENKPVKQMTIDEARSELRSTVFMHHDPKMIFKNLCDELPKFKDGKELTEETTKLIYRAWAADGIESKYLLVQSVQDAYRPMAIELSCQLIKEYDCKTASEKTLAHIATNAYIRALSSSERFGVVLDKLEHTDNETNGFFTMLCKHVDQANRQFITALTALRQLKSPPIEMNIKAKTAFVSQNQQINLNKNENIEPK